MQATRKVLNRIMNVLAGVSLIAMTALTCWQVFTRYVLNNPSTWSEELVGYLFAWASLFGASLITGERGHMNIPVVVEKMPLGAKKFRGSLANSSPWPSPPSSSSMEATASPCWPWAR